MVQVGIIQDQKANGTNGGLPSGTLVWLIRDLNIMTFKPAWLSLAANVFTIDGVGFPGVYEFKWRSPFRQTDRTGTRIVDTVTGVQVGLGSSLFVENGLAFGVPVTGAVQQDSWGSTILVLTTVRSFRLEYNVSNTAGGSTVSLGNATSRGQPEVYSEMILIKWQAV